MSLCRTGCAVYVCALTLGNITVRASPGQRCVVLWTVTQEHDAGKQLHCRGQDRDNVWMSPC